MKSFLAVAIALALFATVLTFDLGFETMTVETKAVECLPEGNYYVPHPEYCDKVVQCFNGYPWVLTCAAGQWWSTVTNSCDYEANVVCEIGDLVSCL